MNKKLKKEFFSQSSSKVGKDLLGKYLVRKFKDGKRIEGKIIETELYKGPEDKAAHTCNGKTKRNRVVWKRGGYLYIYLIYGLHWMLNISTSKDGEPECVLIRAVDTKEFPFKKTNGPGKLTKRFKIDKSFYGEDLTQSNKIWIEDRGEELGKIKKTPRINIDYAGEKWIKKKWRFLIDEYKENLPTP